MWKKITLPENCRESDTLQQQKGAVTVFLISMLLKPKKN